MIVQDTLVVPNQMPKLANEQNQSKFKNLTIVEANKFSQIARIQSQGIGKGDTNTQSMTDPQVAVAEHALQLVQNDKNSMPKFHSNSKLIINEDDAFSDENRSDKLFFEVNGKDFDALLPLMGAVQSWPASFDGSRSNDQNLHNHPGTIGKKVISFRIIDSQSTEIDDVSDVSGLFSYMQKTGVSPQNGLERRMDYAQQALPDTNEIFSNNLHVSIRNDKVGHLDSFAAINGKTITQNGQALDADTHFSPLKDIGIYGAEFRKEQRNLPENTDLDSSINTELKDESGRDYNLNSGQTLNNKTSHIQVIDDYRSDKNLQIDFFLEADLSKNHPLRKSFEGEKSSETNIISSVTGVRHELPEQDVPVSDALRRLFRYKDDANTDIVVKLLGHIERVGSIAEHSSANKLGAETKSHPALIFDRTAPTQTQSDEFESVISMRTSANNDLVELSITSDRHTVVDALVKSQRALFKELGDLGYSETSLSFSLEKGFFDKPQLKESEDSAPKISKEREEVFLDVAIYAEGMDVRL